MTRDEDRFRNEIVNEKVYGEPHSGVIIDIGAHIGLFSEYSQPVATVIYAIEPATNNYQEIIKRIEDNGWSNIKAFNLAIGCEDSTRKLYMGGSDGAWTFSNNSGRSGDYQEIQTMTLRHFMEREGIEHVDLLKIDCEGAEDEIIFTKDFGDITDKIDAIVGELHGSHSLEELKQHGYTIEDTGSSQILRARRIK